MPQFHKLSRKKLHDAGAWHPSVYCPGCESFRPVRVRESMPFGRVRTRLLVCTTCELEFRSHEVTGLSTRQVNLLIAPEYQQWLPLRSTWPWADAVTRCYRDGSYVVWEYD